MRPRIAVIGERTASADNYERARAAGQLIAQRGAVVVCGGLGGVMEAACRGCMEAGGISIGILPGDSAGEANPYVTVPIVTGMGEARNAIVVRSSQVVLAIGGSFGTLSEIALALCFGIPVIGLQTWTFAQAAGSGGVPLDRVQRAADVTAAIELAWQHVRDREQASSS